MNYSGLSSNPLLCQYEYVTLHGMSKSEKKGEAMIINDLFEYMKPTIE